MKTTIAVLRKSACLAGLLVTSTLALAAPAYTITDLGTLNGANGVSETLAINSAGAVAGSAATAASEQSASVYAQGAWSDFGAQAVAAGVGWTNLPAACGINDNGQVTGYGFVTGGAGFHAFLFADGVFTDLNAVIGGTKSQGVAINASGQIAGFYNTSGMPSRVHAYRYADGAAVDLGTLGGVYSSAAAINAGGAVVGESFTSGGDTHAFLHAPGSQMTDLGTLAGDASQSVGYVSIARGINDAGVIVGDSNSPTSSSLRAARYVGGTWTDLGTLGGAGSTARAINKTGVIVGEAEISMNSSLRHAFVWQNGVMSDLNDLIPSGSGWELLFASAINAAGQITGQGTNAHGDRHGYLLTPVAPVVPAAKPVVKISGLKKRTTAKGRLPIKGTVTGAVTSVTYRIGGKSARKAGGKAAWRFVARLQPGKNKITVTAHGPGGNSASARVIVIRS